MGSSRDAASVDGLDETQSGYARQVVAAVHDRGLPKRVAVISIETALAESALLMFANENVPESLRLPHDRVGRDHASVGIFQQQVGGTPVSTADWGTAAELMDLTISTDKFLDALAETDWPQLASWEAAQAVQRSAFPDGSNYRAKDAQAIEIVDALWEDHDDAEEEDDVMRIVTRKGNQPALALQVRGVDDVRILQEAERKALEAIGVPVVELPALQYRALRNRAAEK